MKMEDRLRRFKLDEIMKKHDCAEIVAECILDAMEAKNKEYDKIRDILDECYPEGYKYEGER